MTTESDLLASIPLATIDSLLTAQLAIAWAGERGEEPRLGWCNTDLHSEFGGEDLFRRLLPQTWPWAILQAVREPARRTDARLRLEDHDPDRIVSLYALGFEIDERVDERLLELKRAAAPPSEALPGLQDVIHELWNSDHFRRWLRHHGSADYTEVPVGRRLKGKLPQTLDEKSLDETLGQLLAGFQPLPDRYPLPHFRRST